MTWDTGAPNTSLLTTWLVKKFIPALEDELQFQKFTTKAVVPAGAGNIARWNVFSSPAANVSSLTEGSTSANEITTLTTTGTDATLAEYGEFIVVTRLMEFTQVAGAREELVRRMSYGGARSIDALVRNAADGTTSAFHASTAADGGGTTLAQPAAGSAAAIIGTARQLRDNSARGFAGVPGHPERHLAAIVSPEFELDMVTESAANTTRFSWAAAVQNVPGPSGQGKAVNGFMGSVYGTACYRSQALTQATVTTINSDENFVLAEGGLGAVSIIDADPQIFINTPSAGDVGNPYRNRSTVAWHAYFATSLIDSNRVFKLYTAVT